MNRAHVRSRSRERYLQVREGNSYETMSRNPEATTSTEMSEQSPKNTEHVTLLRSRRSFLQCPKHKPWHLRKRTRPG